MSSYCVPTFSLFSILLLLYLYELCICQMSCGPRMSPRLLMEIPCDMSKTSFCSLPGSAYPWSSVRRYIYENQGFMRRMYGDQRQSQVLRNEIEESREKYDSIYFYGRGSVQMGSKAFGPRSASNDFTPTFSSSSTFSMESNSSTNYQPNKNVENNTLPINESESISTLGREAIDDEEETYSMENSQFDSIPSTTTINTNHEVNDIPNTSHNADQFISSSAPQTTTPSETDSEENETQPKKGVNACPIKEEVVAPYWANNTRGETLALLNVYPFEQYIHWEKCAYENSQMFCREGCKCEQQYRLHRLLAFDPKNECRGIFADWFRFPGCCVCICYDLPQSIVRVNRRKARL